MKDMYPAETVERQRKKEKIWRIAAAAVAILTVTVCAVMCFCTVTANAAVMQIAVCVTAVAGGWITIWMLLNPIQETRREYSHLLTVLNGRLEGAEESAYGYAEVESAPFDIPGSITVKRVRVTDGGQSVNLYIRSKKAGLIPEGRERLHLTYVHGYITGFEVCDEDA